VIILAPRLINVFIATWHMTKINEIDDEMKRRLLDALEELEEEEIEEEAEVEEKSIRETGKKKYETEKRRTTEEEEAEEEERGVEETREKLPPVALVLSAHCPLCQLLSNYQPFRALVVWFHVNRLPIVTPEELQMKYPDLYRACINYSSIYEIISGDASTWIMRYMNPLGFPPQPTISIVTPSIATIEGPILFWNGRPPPDIAYMVQTPPLVATSPPLPRNIIDKSVYFKVATEIMRIHQKIVEICLRHGWKLHRTQLYVRTEPIDLTGQETVRLGGRKKRKGMFPFPFG